MSRITDKDAHWTQVAQKQLLGRRIVAVRYMTQEEADQLGWSNRVVVIQLDDGNLVFPSMDDEGNNGGALFTNDEKNGILPVL